MHKVLRTVGGLMMVVAFIGLTAEYEYGTSIWFIIAWIAACLLVGLAGYWLFSRFDEKDESWAEERPEDCPYKLEPSSPDIPAAADICSDCRMKADCPGRFWCDKYWNSLDGGRIVPLIKPGAGEDLYDPDDFEPFARGLHLVSDDEGFTN